MRLWLVLPYLPTTRLRELAVLAEELGLAGVAIGDHVCVPADVSSIYPYSGQVADLPPGTEFPDPLVLAAGLGAATTRLRCMTYVYLVPLRHPILVAKAAATASALTDGRLDLGVGIGWLREEFEALGVPFSARGALLDEALDVLPELWAGKAVEHRGRHHAFGPLTVDPRPVGHLPIFVGGYSDAALRRAARRGDGWVAVNPSVEDLTTLVAQLRRALEAAGRDPEAFPVRTGLRGRATPERIRAVRDLGIGDLVVMPWQLPEDAGPARIYESTPEAVLDDLPGFVGRFEDVVAGG